MKNFVYDACTLIYLTKIQIKEKLSLLGKVVVSKTVKSELISDLDRFSDAKILKKNIEKKIIKESKLRLKNTHTSENLGKGERETIEICIKIGGIPVTDDHHAMYYALNLGLKPKTSEVILLELLQEEIINYQEFKALFKELAMIKSLNTNIISYFKKKAKNIKFEKNNKSKGGV
ncbi:hypothetical protein LCGC14_0507770 [marine sediment metagenome]|uniref:PIN domain-containing protein n=1 Tax=marine sediment metagenome TaxID=412755 RepID=A0A0F9S240_9ZZZZ